jgi:hypothetical protein
MPVNRRRARTHGIATQAATSSCDGGRPAPGGEAVRQSELPKRVLDRRIGIQNGLGRARKPIRTACATGLKDFAGMRYHTILVGR